MDESTIEELWKLAYRTFEHGFSGGLAPMLATKTMVQEIQFRMMRSIAALKVDAGDKSQLCGAILADVLLSESMGLMTMDTSARMQELLAPYASVQ